MAQLVKHLSHKPDDLNPIPKTHRKVEGWLSSDLHTCSVACVLTHMHTHIQVMTVLSI